MQLIQRVSNAAQVRFHFVHCRGTFHPLIRECGNGRFPLGALRILFFNCCFGGLRFACLGRESLLEGGDLRAARCDHLGEFRFTGKHRLALRDEAVTTLLLGGQRKAKLI